MDGSPFVSALDRFPLGLPGHVVPVSREQPGGDARPWGMDQAVSPAPVRAMGKHDKPTSTRQVSKPTEYSDDSKTRPDTTTQTVTD